AAPRPLAQTSHAKLQLRSWSSQSLLRSCSCSPSWQSGVVVFSRRASVSPSRSIGPCNLLGVMISRLNSVRLSKRHLLQRQFSMRSRPWIVSVRIEQLRAVDLVVGDVPLSFRRHQIIDELLPELLFHVRMLIRVYQHDAVLVEHALVTFDQDLQIVLVLEMNPGAAVGQDVSIDGAGRVERGAHALADRLIP